MIFNEIWIPHIIAVIFLALPLIRPFVQKFWTLDGLAWLPIIALAILVGIFAAYGFRPESLFLFLFAIVQNLANLPLLFSSIRSQSNDSFTDQNRHFLLLALLILFVSSAPIFIFSPKSGNARWERTDNIPAYSQQFSMTAGVLGNFTVRIYGEIEESRPIIFIAAPAMGSIVSLELISAALLERGFTIVTYVRKGYDFPFVKENGEIRFLGFRNAVRYMGILNRASVNLNANKRGREMEADKRVEIEYMLARIFRSVNSSGQNFSPPTLLVGYGAAGSAMVYLAEDLGFASRNSNVMGVVSIEGRLWSLFEEEKIDILPMTSGGFFHKFQVRLINWFRGLAPKKVRLSDFQVRTRFPVLHLVSGSALDRQKFHSAVFQSVERAEIPTAFAAIESAGIFDYQDFPVTHPFYSFLFPGKKGASKSEIPVSDTASIIGNFAALLLQKSGREEKTIPSFYPINGLLYTQSSNMDWFTLD